MALDCCGALCTMGCRVLKLAGTCCGRGGLENPLAGEFKWGAYVISMMTLQNADDDVHHWSLFCGCVASSSIAVV